MIVTLYSKPGCHLCEEVREELDAVAHDLDIIIKDINIEQDPELFARYRYAIPVLLLDGKEIGRGRNARAKARALASDQPQ